MTLSFTTAVADALLNSYGTSLNSTGFLAVFSGAAPVNADAALASGTNTVLAIAAFSATAFPAASAHSLSANAITGQNAYSSGTATFFRTFTEGGSINATAMVSGGLYIINVPGSTVWATYGAPNATAGTVFVANGAGTGSGTCFPATIVEQGSVSTSGADLNLNTVTLSAGGPLSITSFTRTL
jgi:hypothetical protein